LRIAGSKLRPSESRIRKTWERGPTRGLTNWMLITSCGAGASTKDSVTAPCLYKLLIIIAYCVHLICAASRALRRFRGFTPRATGLSTGCSQPNAVDLRVGGGLFSDDAGSPEGLRARIDVRRVVRFAVYRAASQAPPASLSEESPAVGALESCHWLTIYLGRVPQSGAWEALVRLGSPSRSSGRRQHSSSAAVSASGVPSHLEGRISSERRSGPGPSTCRAHH